MAYIRRKFGYSNKSSNTIEDGFDIRKWVYKMIRTGECILNEKDKNVVEERNN